MLHQVGVGALGPVFRTYEPTRDRLVAVKVFRLDIVPEQARALADALSRATEAGLFHPSIVEPIAAGMEGSVAYRAEEYVAAESLDVAMRHYAPAPVEKALPFITQLSGAIDFARAAGIGHGALHPRDIFITPDEARATGFGVVEALEAVGIRAPVRRPYSAPERIDGQPWGVAADIFALAAISFELLTGRRPAGVGREIGTLPDMPHRDAVHAVLARAMDEAPERRYSTALAFAGALEAAWRGEAQGSVLVAAPTALAQADEFTVEQALESGAPAPDDNDETIRTVPDEPLEPLALPLDEVTDVAQVSPTIGMLPLDVDDHDDDVTRITHPEDEPADLEEEPDLLLDDEEPTERYADDFVEAQAAAAEERRPLEAEGEPADLAVADEDEPITHPAFRPDSGVPAYVPVAPEPAGSSVLPVAIGVIIALLVGFAAGAYYMSRQQGAEVTETAAAAAPQQTPPPTSSVPPATAPREFSDQAVAPAPVSPAPAAPAPSRPSETPTPPASRTQPVSPAPAVRRGTLVVRSTPSRAGVTVNNRWRGRTPLTLDSLPFGRYTVRIVQPGFRPERQEVVLDAGNTNRTVTARLEAEAPPAPRASATNPRAAAPSRESNASAAFTGSLFVDSRPQGAFVLLDGKNVGTTPLRLSNVPIGSHVVRLDLAVHRPWSSAVRVVAGEEKRVTASLEEIR